MSSGALGKLADFVAATRFSDLPDAVVLKAKRHGLDTIGVALAGATSEEAIRATRTLLRAGHAGAAPLWGTSATLAPREAALVNGVAAHAFELDDTGGCDHSGAVVLPAVIAAAPLSSGVVSGRDLVTAIVLGYEIGRRIMEGFGGYVPHNGAGWHSTGTCGVFAAAAGCASLLRLPPSQTQACLGIASSFASGLWGFIHDGAMTKRLHPGRAAEGGLLAALLAREDVSGPGRAFDDVWGGFFKTYGGREPNVVRLTGGLGREWMLQYAAIKPYASCRDAHAAVDAIGRVIEREKLGQDDIVSVAARLNDFLDGMVGGRDVSTMPAAQMSLPYAVAARIRLGHAGLSAYAEECRRDPRLLSVLGRVTIVRDETVQASWASSLVVVTRDGRRFEEPTLKALGAPENPLTLERLRDKFDGLARLVLPAQQANELADMMLDIDGLDDIAPLQRRLAL